MSLTKSVDWEHFGRYAHALVGALEGKVLHQADSPVERVWTVAIRGQEYWLSYNDFPLFDVSLDSKYPQASEQMPEIREALLEIPKQEL